LNLTDAGADLSLAPAIIHYNLRGRAYCPAFCFLAATRYTFLSALQMLSQM
jgi:hypothetical protein